MSNSSMVSYTKISPHKNPRKNAAYNPSGKITKITIHHMAGNLSVETCGNVFQTREASSNYGISSDGKVGLYVPEDYRSWASASKPNDYKAVTIEVANDGGAPDWHVSDKALETLIALCADICKRNGIEKLNYTGDSSGNLTRHNMFIATTCPGPYLQGKFSYIAQQVNKRLNGTEEAELYRVRKSWTDAKSQVGAFAVLANAKACADDHPGYAVYDESGNEVYENRDDTQIEVTYRVQSDGVWGPEVKGPAIAGETDKPVTAFMVKAAKGKVWYQAHLAKENRWLNRITGYNVNDFKNGYAGNGKGHPIDAVRVYFTSGSLRPYRQAHYRVGETNRDGMLHWQEDNSTKNGMDGYAGNANGHAIDHLQIQVKAR